MFAVLQTAALLALSAHPVVASHSVFEPRQYWDFNRDVTPDPDVDLYAAGGGWTAAMLDRFGEAAWQWRNYSNFNPTGYPSNQTPPKSRKVYVDGTDPADLFKENPGLPAYARVVKAHSQYMNYAYRITNAWIFFNTREAGHPRWHTAVEQPTGSIFDFKGVMTHEIGHLARLRDMYPRECHYSDIYTMCVTARSNYKAYDTFRMRTLESDDIYSVNRIY